LKRLSNCVLCVLCVLLELLLVAEYVHWMGGADYCDVEKMCLAIACLHGSKLSHTAWETASSLCCYAVPHGGVGVIIGDSIVVRVVSGNRIFNTALK